MTSPFKEASTTKRKVKLFIYGPPGSGKTTFSLQFPKVAMIDMERGSELYGDSFNFDLLPATTADEVMDAINWLLTNKHDYRTVVLDPITVYWAALQQKWSDIFMERNKKSKGYKFEFYDFQPRDWMTIKAELKLLIRRLIALDMNVIVTAHQKPKYADGELMKVIGDTFDGEKSLPYLFDTVLQLERKGDKFMARPEKDRTGSLPVTPFEISYKYFAELFGEEFLESEAVPVTFITDKQKEEIETWIITFQMPQDRVKKRLADYNAESLDELTTENAQLIIDKFKEAYDKKQKEAVDA